MEKNPSLNGIVLRVAQSCTDALSENSKSIILIQAQAIIQDETAMIKEQQWDYQKLKQQW